jgi:putative transmembrane protein PGPGW
MWRSTVFLAGLLCITAGVALAVLPGPLTIPPIALGLYVWSTEFRWARRLFGVFRNKGRRAWQHARRHPLSASAVTVGGLLGATLAMWSVGHFHLVAWVGDLFPS